MIENTEHDSQGEGSSEIEVRTESDACIHTEKLNLYYSQDIHALRDITLSIPRNKVTAFIGPSGLWQVQLNALFQPYE